MMLKSTSDIMSEIDMTIDQLLENATALNKIAHKKEYEEEKLALERMQESLLAHLIHMDELLKQKQPKHLAQANLKPLLNSHIHDKLGRSGYLNQTSKYLNRDAKPAENEELEEIKAKKPKIHKKKSFAMKLVTK